MSRLGLLLFAIFLANPAHGQQDSWPPESISGCWKIEFVEYSENGVVQSVPRRIWPSFCIFAGEYYYSMMDQPIFSASGVKLSAHETKGDEYFLLWPYHTPAIRLHLRKLADEEYLMIQEERPKNIRTRITFKLTRIDKKRACDRVQQLLNNEKLHPTMLQFRDDADSVLKKWMKD